MRLTLHTDYALRTLIFLGLHQERRVSIHEIADAYGISENHLMKVIQKLGRPDGFIETTRGRGGGLRLARAPDKIRLDDVVRYTEEDMAIVACFQQAKDHEACVLTGYCGLQSILGEALAAFLAVLQRYTLADLLSSPDRAQIMRLLTPSS
ncbi:RrF2 family transcriptional regulator [Beijerinckia indica]|uniref:Transcriptional regulator, BadM/Rrf2 family n=1 Tax=Beijerinckia indica subsp. indica (strain ATCC 9039 / DSM 1715 / NCIMB 8712) TaxID=395963 RepID=B2IF31_BEII9|nr:Rrf2 family transcriptional regulator [Beijerinckia indica]ACB95596.1 transcriptional regulator, BadM/Rrf2 family [Beijerinckia indica subsp. indica ATCC 9039]